VHLDPLGSDETSNADLTDFSTDELIGRNAPGRDEDSRPPAREGLPKRFRMRHGRHYVDELLGDTPLRTVREIPISEIEPPPDEALNLDPLEDSIRELGILEPLLVARRGLEYRVLAGMRRLRAARTVGLNTVPCLVQDVDEEKAMELRQAVAGRIVAPAPVDPVAAPRDEPAADPDPALDPGLRRAVLADLGEAEALRAKTLSAAIDILSRPTIVERASASPAAIVGDAIAAVALEARLRGVRVEMVWPENDAPMSLDAGRCRTALVGLLQSMLSLSARETTALEVRTQMTIVRPALIVECRLRRDGREQTLAGDEGLIRFFDAAWTDHPCGHAGAQALAALSRVARAHGGRVHAAPTAVTFVIPKLLSEW
jgi:hypothetical protein